MRENSPSRGFAGRALSWLLPFLVISAAYLYTFPQPNIFYAGVVLLHALGGVVTAILLIPALFRLLREGSFVARAGWLLVAAGAVLGIILIKTGTPRTEWKWLYFHIVISLIGVGLLIADKLRPARMVVFECRNFCSSRSNLPGLTRRSRLRRALHARKLADARPHPESRHAARQHERRRRWTRGRVLPQFRAGLRQAENSQQVLHGVRLLQALPRRHLQPVVQFGASFFFVQQSVVSQVDRVHAGYDRHQAFEMVRRMPRSGRALQRVDGYSDQADRASAGIAGWPGLHDVPLHRQREEHDGPGRIFIWSIPSCTSWPPRRIPWRAPARFPDPAESRAAPPRVPQAVHANADRGILFHRATRCISTCR